MILVSDFHFTYFYAKFALYFKFISSCMFLRNVFPLRNTFYCFEFQNNINESNLNASDAYFEHPCLFNDSRGQTIFISKMLYKCQKADQTQNICVLINFYEIIINIHRIIFPFESILYILVFFLSLKVKKSRSVSGGPNGCTTIGVCYSTDVNLVSIRFQYRLTVSDLIYTHESRDVVRNIYQNRKYLIKLFEQNSF